MRTTRSLSVAVLGTIACTGVVAAQAERVTAVSPVVQFLLFLTTTLIVGSLTISIGPRFTERTADSIREEPVPALLIGVTVLVAVVLVLFVAALFGPLVYLVVVPLILLAVVGQAISVIAVGRVVVDQFQESSVRSGLAVGTPLVALTSFVPVLGGVIGFVLWTVGVGAIVRDQVL